jgi:hypothetical protein
MFEKIMSAIAVGTFGLLTGLHAVGPPVAPTVPHHVAAAPTSPVFHRPPQRKTPDPKPKTKLVVHHHKRHPRTGALMYDASSPTMLPASIPPHSVIAGYGNGSWPWPASAVHHYEAEGHPYICIDVNGTDPHCQVLDVEHGDATPQQAPLWVKARKALHPDFIPIVYTDRTNYGYVTGALKAAGLTGGKDYMIWVATATPSVTHYGNSKAEIGTQNIWSPDFDRSVLWSKAFLKYVYGSVKS